jgi:hypothetical protein
MVHCMSARSVNVVGKLLLQVNQSALPRAVGPVLQGGERDGVIYDAHVSAPSIEQAIEQGIAADAVMRRHGVEHCGERANAQGVVPGHGEVMLALCITGPPHMAAGLSRDVVAKPT